MPPRKPEVDAIPIRAGNEGFDCPVEKFSLSFSYTPKRVVLYVI